MPSWAHKCYYPWTGHLEAVHQFGVISDIYDSPNWKKHPELIPASGNMGLLMFIDGANVYKTAKHSATPVFLMNANLPPLERCKQK